MHERIKTYLRHAAILTIPVLAVVGCRTDSKSKPVRPTAIQTEAQTPVTNASSQLSPERQIFLKEARAKSMGVIFINITDFDPIQSVFLDIKELDPQTGTTIDKNTQKLYDPSLGQKSNLIETGILIKNCNGIYQVGISTDGLDFSALGFSDPQTGEIKPTFTINSQECFKALSIPVRSFILPSPNS